MKPSNEYTHGGSAWKNIKLLLRALLNIVAFTTLWYGISLAVKDMNNEMALLHVLIGGIEFVLCFVLNLVVPFMHRVK